MADGKATTDKVGAGVPLPRPLVDPGKGAPPTGDGRGKQRPYEWKDGRPGGKLRVDGITAVRREGETVAGGPPFVVFRAKLAG